MKNQKKLIIIIGIIVFIICIVCIALLMLNKNNNGSETEILENLAEGEGDPINVEYESEKLSDPTKFFSIEECIKNNLDENFIAEDMNILDGESIASYAVKGKIGENGEDVYLIFRIDNENSTYSMEELDNIDNIDNINLATDITEIRNNGNNTFEYTTVSSEEMCRKYLKDFVQKELTNPEEAYSRIDEQYKEKRFPTFEEYQEYINNCRDIIQNAVLSQYSAEVKDDYVEYILVDNYNNSYTVRAEGVWNYKILLDNYTIKVDTYEEQYSKLQNEEKVQANVYIFLQMINTKDYSHAYELLDQTFRNNNFDTLDKFKEYVNANFFSYNLNTTSDVDIDNEGSTYIYETTLRNNAGSAAQRKHLTVIMQLKEGTDFVMSFSIE